MNTSNEEINIEEVEGKSPEVFDTEAINNALFYMDDLMERTLLRFVLSGDVARQIFLGSSNIEAEKLEFLVKDTDLTKYGVSTWKSLVKDFEIKDGKILTAYKGVPIEITVLVEDTQFIKNPDRIFHLTTQFEIPNPFEEYWEVKDELK